MEWSEVLSANSSDALLCMEQTQVHGDRKRYSDDTSESSNSKSSRFSSLGFKDFTIEDKVDPFEPIITEGQFNSNHTNQQPLVASENPLPNDSCLITREQESKFMSFVGAEDYKQHSQLPTIVYYSRSHKKNFTIPTDVKVTKNVLEDYFADSGHTIGINHKLSYARFLNFDLDCACRTKHQYFKDKHLNDEQLEKILEALKGVIATSLSVKQSKCKTSYNVEVFELECNYHIYTDIPVSLFLHLHILNSLKATLVVKDANVIIEVPTYMPLPYSAKKRGFKYTPSKLGQKPINNYNYITEFSDNITVKTIMLHDNVVINDRIKKHATITTTFDKYLICPSVVTTKEFVLTYKNVINFEVSPGYEPFIAFLDETNTKDEITDSLDAIFPTELAVKQSVHDIMNLNNFDQFIIKFNYLFFGKDNSVRLNEFLSIALDFHYGLFLEAIVIALYKHAHVNIEDTTCDKFKIFLRLLFADHIASNQPLSTFIELFSPLIVKAYEFLSVDEILNYIHLLYVNEYQNPNISPRIIIQSYVLKQLRLESLDVFREKLNTMRVKERNTYIDEVVTIYFDALITFRFICVDTDVNTSKGRHFIVNEQFMYVSLNSVLELPGAFLEKPQLEKKLSTLSDKLKKKHFETSAYMIHTPVGVFNSVTGLYTSKFPLLQFCRSRDIALWPLDKTIEITNTINYEIVSNVKRADYIMSAFNEKFNLLYYLSFYIPSLVQLQNQMELDELQLLLLYRKAQEYDYTDDIKFIFDYYPIHPKIVYLMMYLEYEDITDEKLFSYEKLKESIFGQSDIVYWGDHFKSELDSVTYDACEKYSDIIVTIQGNHLHEKKSRIAWFYYWLKAVCLTHSNAHKYLFTNLNIQPMIVKPEYHAFYGDGSDMHVCPSGIKKHIEYAIEYVFGTQLNAFEMKIILGLYHLSMPNNFRKFAVDDTINVASLLYTTYNVKKKVIIIYGKGNAGKSYFVDMLTQMVSPCFSKHIKIEDAVLRSNITQAKQLNIVNEFRSIDMDTMKTISGNDTVSSKIFFNQHYDNTGINQGLILGPTNTIINFLVSNTQTRTADKASVDRIHCIKFTAEFVAYDVDDSSYSPHLAVMVGRGRYFTNIFPLFDKTEATKALAWIAFSSYKKNRSVNMEPYLNHDNPDVISYKNEVFIENNAAYALLTNCGFVDAPGYVTKKTYINTIVNAYVAEKKIQMPSNFFKQLDVLYAKTEHLGTLYQDIIPKSHLTWFEFNLSTVEQIGSVITKIDLEERINKCLMGSETNANRFFAKYNHKYYVAERQEYVGVAFQNELIVPSEDNNDSSMFHMTCY